MARPSIETVPVTDALVRDLTGLWLAARVASGASPEMAARTASDGRVSDLVAREDVRALLGRLDGEPVGFAIVTDNPFGLSATPEFVIQQLYVVESARRQGVARALLGAVLGLAERAGCEVVGSNVPSHSRDTNRFFARLGFASVTVHRVVPTTALRRKLAPEQRESGLEVLRRRRTSRRARAGQVAREAEPTLRPGAAPGHA